MAIRNFNNGSLAERLYAANDPDNAKIEFGHGDNFRLKTHLRSDAPSRGHKAIITRPLVISLLA